MCRVTIKAKVSEIPELKQIAKSYSDAVKFALDKCFENSPKNKFALHHICYKDIRKLFNIKSQFAINCIAQAFETYQSTMRLEKVKPVMKNCNLVFDKRLASFKWDSIRIATNDKRIDIPLKIAKYYAKYSGWKFQVAELVSDWKGRYFFHITLSKDISISNSNTTQIVVGVDVGVRNLAVTSNGQIFKAYRTKFNQYTWLRRKLQRKGTKSAKHKLKTMRNRWQRFMRHINHCVSKEIVKSGDCFALEDLTNIRKQTTSKYRKSKKRNRWLSNWSFRQLQTMISYKAELEGKVTGYFNPYKTSTICSNCLKDGFRFRDRFFCPHCKSTLDADQNASYNLRRLFVNQPIVPIHCQEQSISKTVKPHDLACGIGFA